MPGTNPAPIPQPAVAAAEERQLQIWLTPHGFLKAAMENNATAKKGNGGTVVSFTEGKFKIERHHRQPGSGHQDRNLASRIRSSATCRSRPIIPDYKDFNGVKFPTMIVQKQGGYPVLELTVTDVRVNPGLSLPVPAPVQIGQGPAGQRDGTEARRWRVVPRRRHA